MAKSLLVTGSTPVQFEVKVNQPGSVAAGLAKLKRAKTRFFTEQETRRKWSFGGKRPVM